MNRNDVLQIPTCHHRNDVLLSLHLGNLRNDVLLAKSYDARGNPTGTVEYTFGRKPRNRIGCVGWMFILFTGGFFLLWPLDLEPRVLTAGEAWVVTVVWWCFLGMIPMALWLRPRVRERNRQHEIARRERGAKKRALGGRPDVDLRAVGQDGL